MAHSRQAWFDWSPELRDRQPVALGKARRQYGETLTQCQFEQFLFYRQWGKLKQYANERGILIFGDIPLFVGYDSADVWSRRNEFLLDRQGQREIVAGVPPDYFSADGQLWGNPHYAWEPMQKDGFQ